MAATYAARRASHNLNTTDAAPFRRIFERVHAAHPDCLADEWLTHPCADAHGRDCCRPIVWSRRNGPWHRHEVIFVGAAPGNAGGKGGGRLGAHGTRIPFGGDVAGANLDVLLGSIGLDRNHTFLAAALNQLPAAGGGEPGLAELQAPVGDYPSSLHLLRDTIIACGPGLLVALGNVALRAALAAVRIIDRTPPPRLPALSRIRRAGLPRNQLEAWPQALLPAESFGAAWRSSWGAQPLPHLLLITHPSAQNMSPFAGPETRFHTRMLDARAALRHAVAARFGWVIPATRAEPPADGIYALPEWRELVAPRHARLDRLWRARGV